MRKALIIIPARKGSKRVKNKNIRIVNKKPLIYWTIKYAKKYINNEDIVVSSDSKKIHDISVKEGVQFISRPKKISRDNSEIYFTIFDVLQKIKNRSKYKYIILLQPTSPLRPKKIISNSIRLIERNKKFENLIHLQKTHYNIGKLSKSMEWLPNLKNIKRTQQIDNQFRPSGCLFLYKIKNFENYKKFLNRKTLGFVAKKNEITVNIDTEEDFLKLNFLLKNKHNLKLDVKL